MNKAPSQAEEKFTPTQIKQRIQEKYQRYLSLRNCNEKMLQALEQLADASGELTNLELQLWREPEYSIYSICQSELNSPRQRESARYLARKVLCMFEIYIALSITPENMKAILENFIAYFSSLSYHRFEKQDHQLLTKLVLAQLKLLETMSQYQLIMDKADRFDNYLKGYLDSNRDDKALLNESQIVRFKLYYYIAYAMTCKHKKVLKPAYRDAKHAYNISLDFDLNELTCEETLMVTDLHIILAQYNADQREYKIAIEYYMVSKEVLAPLLSEENDNDAEFLAAATVLTRIDAAVEQCEKRLSQQAVKKRRRHHVTPKPVSNIKNSQTNKKLSESEKREFVRTRFQEYATALQLKQTSKPSGAWLVFESQQAEQKQALEQFIRAIKKYINHPKINTLFAHQSVRGGKVVIRLNLQTSQCIHKWYFLCINGAFEREVNAIKTSHTQPESVSNVTHSLPKVEQSIAKAALEAISPIIHKLALGAKVSHDPIEESATWSIRFDYASCYDAMSHRYHLQFGKKTYVVEGGFIDTMIARMQSKLRCTVEFDKHHLAITFTTASSLEIQQWKRVCIEPVIQALYEQPVLDDPATEHVLSEKQNPVLVTNVVDDHNPAKTVDAMAMFEAVLSRLFAIDTDELPQGMLTLTSAKQDKRLVFQLNSNAIKGIRLNDTLVSLDLLFKQIAQILKDKMRYLEPSAQHALPSIVIRKNNLADLYHCNGELDPAIEQLQNWLKQEFQRSRDEQAVIAVQGQQDNIKLWQQQLEEQTEQLNDPEAIVSEICSFNPDRHSDEIARVMTGLLQQSLWQDASVAEDDLPLVAEALRTKSRFNFCND